MLTEIEIQKLFNDIFLGIITVDALPINLYNETTKELLKSLYKGYGGSLVNFEVGSPNFELLSKLRTNIYEFSGAKTFQQVKDTQALIYNSSGFKRPFNDFKRDANTVYNNYNKNWLKAEFNTTISQANSAAEWVHIQENKEALPNLIYRAVGDSKTRDDHRELDGQIHPVDSDFWDSYMPPLGFNCRCEVVQIDTDQGKLSSKATFFKPEKLFRNNSGKEGNIFRPESHPYFKVGNKFQQKKDNNFGLNIPNKD